MRAIFIALLLCLPFAARAAVPEPGCPSAASLAQALEDQGRELLGENRFQAALEKLEAANRLESTSERLLAIARCHRELAYASVREAARQRPNDSVMRQLAQALGDLEAGRAGPSLNERQEMPAAVAAREGARFDRQEPRPEVIKGASPRIRLVAAAGIGTVVLLAASGAAHLHASSIASGLSDPNTPDKLGLQVKVNNWQTGSNMLLGAGLLMAAVTAGLFAARF
jgi:hypothetical protein